MDFTTPIDITAVIGAVKKHKDGDVVTIVVSRSGQEIEIKTELEEYTESNL